jgi:hypothetical protein
MLRGVIGFVMLISSLIMTSQESLGGIMSDDITVRLQVQDEAGQPVAYASVWRIYEPISPKSTRVPIPVEKLLDVASRYFDSYEMVHSFWKPIDGLRVLVMTDERGQTKDNLRFKEDLAMVRPDRFKLAYVVFRRGYKPAEILFTAGRQDSRLVEQVTLERDGARPTVEPPYMRSYDQLLRELSDTARNEHYRGGSGRIDEIREKLTRTAEEALHAGDRHTAARIYARMETMPEVVTFNGRPAGFAQVNIESPRSRAAIQRAYEIEPDDVYIRMRRLWTEGADLISKTSAPEPTQQDKERLAPYVERCEQLIQDHGSAVWPGFRASLVYDHLRLDDIDGAYKHLNWLQTNEPYYGRYERMIEMIKRKEERIEKRKKGTEGLNLSQMVR